MLLGIADAGSRRVFNPVDFIRSLYLLGEIHENQGNSQQAREYYRRFLDHWADGDMDRDRVEHARRFVAAS